MKILFYCQHVLGIGHYFRSLAICEALSACEVSLALGGPDVDLPLPGHVSPFRLPGLRMDGQFSRLTPVERGRGLDEVKERRRAALLRHFHDFAPDAVVLELYPFGRKAFRFELDPLLAAARQRGVPVACSLRDILVEKKDQRKFENRVVDCLNRFFALLLVHSDPAFIPLDRTFGATGRLTVPIRYTGFVTKPPPALPGKRSPAKPLIVASAGGGSVGFELLKAAAAAGAILHTAIPHHMRVYTGPYMDEEGFQALAAGRYPGLILKRFSSRFTARLQEADLSISMAGYNTTMNLLAAGTPALVHPFAQNREQRLRARAFSPPLTILEGDDLTPENLAARMEETLIRGPLPGGGPYFVDPRDI